MLVDTQSKKIGKEFLLAAAVSSLFIIATLPSVFILAKIAIGLAMIPLTAIAIKIIVKAASNTLQKSNMNHNTETQSNFTQEHNMNQGPTIQDKVRNTAIGSIAVLVGGMSLLIMAKTGLIITCVAIIAVASYEYTKNEGIGKDVSEELDKVANNTIEFIMDNKIANDTIEFIVSNVENYTPQARTQK